ncbi:MAG TPA: phosphodiester glycosidase family protein [Gaiellaceae bacterium]|nr:phosphodiester glycosidase family protein [Gaiellaceae bacterium]
MLRKVFILAVVFGALAVPAADAARRQTTPIVSQQLLMPGVTYQRQVQFTSRGPVVLDVVTAPKPDGSLYTLGPALAHGVLFGTEPLTGIEKDASGAATVVGVNGDFFTGSGPPTGIVMRGGALDAAPISSRSSLVIAPDGTLTVAPVAFDGTWRGTGQRRQLDLNDKPVAGHTTLYTPAWGATTPPESPGVVVDVIASLPPLQPNAVASGVVTEQDGTGGIPIPPGGAVLVSRGAQAPYLSAEAPPGQTIEIRPTLTPNLNGKLAAIGGGPLLVSAGKAVFRANESFDDSVLDTRGARSAVGQLADGRILLVTAEGGGSAYSAGMTNYELANAMVNLGAVTAMGLGSGTPAGMAFDGTLLTRPSTKVEPPIGDALLLSYTGVYAAPPSSDVVSPNGDGFDDTETFSYKLIAPSQVTATLSGPGGALITLAQDSEQPGVHTLTWNGQPNTEGQWRFVVSGTATGGQTTTAERDVLLDDTLGALQVSPPSGHIAAGATAVTAGFQLAHPATVSATIETRTGIVLATLVNKRLQPGAQSLPWNGRLWTGSLAFTGAYQVHVVATNSIGTVSLVAPFVARR